MNLDEMVANIVQVDDKPWGSYRQFILNAPCTVKILDVKPHQALSLQRHSHREEFWRILAGAGTVRVGDIEYTATPGKEYHIPRETLHRITTDQHPLCILEIGLGRFDESDIVRIEDRYHRIQH